MSGLRHVCLWYTMAYFRLVLLYSSSVMSILAGLHMSCVHICSTDVLFFTSSPLSRKQVLALSCIWICQLISVLTVVQGTQLVYCRHVHVKPAQTVLGSIMWGIGFALDVQSDLILQDLRRRNPHQGVSISTSLSSLHALTCP